MSVGDGGGDGCNGAVGVIVLVVLAFFVLIGAIMVFVAIVVWIQSVVARVMQLRALREMTGEYVVQDLAQQAEQPQSEPQPQPTAPPPSASAPPAASLASAPLQQQLITPQPEPQPETTASSSSPVTRSDVQQALMNDLQAVYGMRDQRVTGSFHLAPATTAARDLQQQQRGSSA